MKRISIFIAALAAVVSCTSEMAEQQEERIVERQYIASFEGSRTSLVTDGMVDWCAGDTVRYYCKKNGAVGKSVIKESGHEAGISVQMSESASFLVLAYGGTGISNNISGASFTLDGAIPAEQSGRFEDAHVSVAKTYEVDGGGLQFHNVTSLVKFTLTRSDIRSVVFTATDGTRLHGNGEVNFTFSDVNATASFGDAGDSSICIKTGEAGTFYMSTLPCTVSNFKMLFYGDDDVCIGQIVGANQLTLAQNGIVNLGTLDSRITEIPPTDLSAAGTANCYIVSEPGKYSFKADVKGNSATALDGTPYKAEVLWESFGTDVKPNAGDVVSAVSYKDGCIRFTAGRNGNALIAVENRDEEVLWSWHIWICEGYDPEAARQTYNHNAGIMMDRNLGATSATPGDIHAMGLLYQWGRKDPFMGGASTSGNVSAATTTSWPEAVLSNSTVGTIAYTIANPTTFITYNGNNWDWYYTGTTATDNTRWSTSDNEKSIYDPCPMGWRVPDGGVWPTAFGSAKGWITASNWDSANHGMHLEETDRNAGTGSIWYPAAGHRQEAGGQLKTSGTHGFYWSCTPHESSACRFNMADNGLIYPGAFGLRSAGNSVRCMKDGSFVPASKLNLEVHAATIEVGETATVKYTILPDNTSDRQPSFTSGDDSIASVDSYGTITGIAAGKVDITVSVGTLSSVFNVNVEPASYDLSAPGTANCYIVSKEGKYKFNATVKGGSNECLEAPAAASVLWETFGTNVTPSVGDLVNSVTFRNGHVYFQATSTKGNALIAVLDSAGTILWSWHIWLTDTPADQVYNNNAGTMMDRNLGATSAAKGSFRALGLLYQWGRKDPFTGSSDFEYDKATACTITWPWATSSTATCGTVEYSVRNPTTFIMGNSSNYDWYYTGSSSTDDTRWTPEDLTKSIYDPCPPGYRVPDGEMWSTAFGYFNDWRGSNNWDGTYRGMDFGSTDVTLGSGTIWYPAAGYILYSSAKLGNVGGLGFYWSSKPYYENACCLGITNGDYVRPMTSRNRANGQSVRCCKEK